MGYYHIFSHKLALPVALTVCFRILAQAGCGGSAVPDPSPDPGGTTAPPAGNSSGGGQVTPAGAGPGQSPGGTVTDDPPPPDPIPTAAEPTISPAGGTFANSVTVTLACATEGAAIVYTTDGTTPTATSTLYTGPFELSRSRVLLVKALKLGYTDSTVATANFVILIPGQLLRNGSFEEGADPGPWLTLLPGATNMPGWTVINGGIDWIGTYRVSSDGTRSLDLDGSPGFGGVEQTFPTIPGHRYKLTFDLAGNIDDDPKPLKTMRVEAAGQTADFQFDITGHTHESIGWTRHEWFFNATAATTTLKIYSTDKTGGWGGPSLDNVAVIDTTTP